MSFLIPGKLYRIKSEHLFVVNSGQKYEYYTFSIRKNEIVMFITPIKKDKNTRHFWYSFLYKDKIIDVEFGYDMKVKKYFKIYFQLIE